MHKLISDLIVKAQRNSAGGKIGTASNGIYANSGMMIMVTVQAQYDLMRLAYSYTITLESVRGTITCHNAFEASVKLDSVIDNS